MNALKNIKINFQVMAIPVAAILGFVIVAVANFANNQIASDLRAEQSAATEVVRTVSAIQVGFLQNRRSEKDFFLRGTEKFAIRHTEQSAETMVHFDELAGLFHEPDDIESAAAMKGLYEQYVIAFDEVVAIRKEIGFSHNEGLRGDLRKAVKEAEAQINLSNSPRLEAAILMMRRSEKDFMLRGDLKYVDKHSTSLEKFRVVAGEEISDELDRKYVSDKVEMYATDFRKVADRMQAEEVKKKAMSILYAR